MKNFATVKKLFTISLLVLSFVFSSCKKEEIQGPKGDPGTPGIGGNSNIVSSGIFAIASSQWVPNADTTVWKFKLDAPQITAEVASKGAVKVLIQELTAWWELPYLSGEFFMQFGFSEGIVNFSYLDPHGSPLPKPATAYFRIVTITEVAKAAHPDLDLWNNLSGVQLDEQLNKTQKQ